MKGKLQSLWQNKSVRIAAIGILALVLLLVVWKVFFSGKEEKTAANGYVPTEREARLAVLLEKIEGVEGTSVMICEEEGTAVGAVVIFEGEDGILIRTRLMEAAAKALGLHTGDIAVYPANS